MLWLGILLGFVPYVGLVILLSKCIAFGMGSHPRSVQLAPDAWSELPAA
jgi:hypothetical protein